MRPFISKIIQAATGTALTLMTTPAFAEGVQAKDPSELTSKIVQLVQQVGMPVGGALLFLAVCIGAIELIMARGKAEDRARVMGGLLYIAIGGIILGGALFFAGVFLGIGQNVFGGS